jgi:signal recognition particle receptor subunit beta
MVSATSNPVLDAVAVKILIAGGFGVGKTTMVGTVSEISPLRTEELITEASEGVDDLTGVERKTTTTVALDFGRITINPQLILYLFGTPGQNRFWFMWDELAHGSVGAVVLIDLRRVDDCFPAIDYFENRRLPFVAAINEFADTTAFSDGEIRDCLVLPADCPIVRLDARDDASCRKALIVLVEHALTRTPR